MKSTVQVLSLILCFASVAIGDNCPRFSGEFGECQEQFIDSRGGPGSRILTEPVDVRYTFSQSKNGQGHIVSYQVSAMYSGKIEKQIFTLGSCPTTAAGAVGCVPARCEKLDGGLAFVAQSSPSAAEIIWKLSSDGRNLQLGTRYFVESINSKHTNFSMACKKVQ